MVKMKRVSKRISDIQANKLFDAFAKTLTFGEEKKTSKPRKTATTKKPTKKRVIKEKPIVSKKDLERIDKILPSIRYDGNDYMISSASSSNMYTLKKNSDGWLCDCGMYIEQVQKCRDNCIHIKALRKHFGQFQSVDQMIV